MAEISQYTPQTLGITSLILSVSATVLSNVENIRSVRSLCAQKSVLSTATYAMPRQDITSLFTVKNSGTIICP
jgi:hypothetical protein